MPLGTDDGQTARLAHLRGELDVGTTARHVGGDGNHALPSGLGHDLGFLHVHLGVEHIVRNLAQVELTAE